MQTATFDEKLLYEKIKKLEIIDEATLLEIWQAANDQDFSFAELLHTTDTLEDHQLGTLIAEIYEVPFVRLSDTPFSQKSLDLISPHFAREHLCIPFGVEPHQIKLATANPLDKVTLSLVEKATGLPSEVHYATSLDIENSLDRYYSTLDDELQSLMTEYTEQVKTSAHNKKNEEVDPPIMKLVDTLLKFGHQRKVSDIHLEPEEEKANVRFRIDGLLQDVFHFPLPIHQHVVTRIKVMSKLRIDEHQAPQDGKLNFEYNDNVVDVRVSTAPTTTGEKVVMRLLSERSRQMSLSDLGMFPKQLQAVRSVAEKPHGMILCTGPTGSGKTTTLYAILKLLNQRDVNIMTVEDPVEYDLYGINQIQVNPKADVTFSSGLRSIVRQDPDIILVGEIRDEETADIAVNSAMTGHTVLSSLHTNDAATAFPRLQEMGVEPFIVSSSVNVVIAQRLVRKICQACRVSKQVPRNTLLAGESEDSYTAQLINRHYGEEEQVRVYTGKGCSVCNQTGYRGRIGIFELLVVDETIQEAITKNLSATEIANRARKAGMQTMYEDGLEKMKQGLTSLDEILRVTKAG